MTSALNMTMPIKQDAATLAKLEHIKKVFATHVQPQIDKALRESQIVHYARVLITPDNRWIQVITEFDGPKDVYTEWFRKNLPTVFETIFSVVEGVPPWEELNNEAAFYRTASKLNLSALGASTTWSKENAPEGEEDPGYFFAAYPDTTVEQILQKSAT